jgi:hypothetical protein
MKPFVRTSIAVAILAALGAYYYFVERKRPATTEKVKEKVFAGLDRKKIKEISLVPAGGEAVRLVKAGEAWTMTQPLTAPAAANEVDALVSSIESLEIDEVVAETAADASEYGLAPARSTVGVLVEGATEPLKLELGRKTPDDAGLYARIPTSPRIFTIAGYQDTTFSKKPFDLRDREILHIKRDDVATLEVSGPEPGFALARADNGEWVFTRPLRTLAGRWSVDGLVGTLESLRMESIAAEPAKDLKPFGLVKPERLIALGLKDGRKKVLEIGSSAPDDKFYAREASSAVVAVIAKTLVDELKKGMGDLRAKRLLDVSVYEIEGFDIDADGTKRVFARSTTKDKEGLDAYTWKRTAPDKKDIETNPLQDVLFKIGGIEVAEFIDHPQAPASYGLDKPELKVSLRMGAGKPATSFEVGQKDGAYFGRRPNDDAILKLDKSKAEELVKAFKGL